jgi:hypothetical protein
MLIAAAEQKSIIKQYDMSLLEEMGKILLGRCVAPPQDGATKT